MNNKGSFVVMIGLVIPTLTIATSSLKLSSIQRESIGLKPTKNLASNTISEIKNLLSEYDQSLEQTAGIADDSTEAITRQEKVNNSPEMESVKNQSIEEFINVIGEQARKIADDHDLYASIMIAQAILESGAGTSSLSIPPYYNLFGIKGDYKGATVIMRTQEDDGEGSLFTIDSKFRQYSSYKESLENYAQLLQDGVDGNDTFYKGAWKSESKNYQEASESLTGKYATDVQYAEKLNQLIQLYNLTNYDIYQKEENSKQSPFAAKVIRDLAVKANKIKWNKGNELNARYEWRYKVHVLQMIRQLYLYLKKALQHY